jgi:hypothetical protein
MPSTPSKRRSTAMHAWRKDPALAANLAAIGGQAFEAGASLAYVVRDPQVLVLRDGSDHPVDTGPAATVLVLLFPCRDGGELALQELQPDDVRPHRAKARASSSPATDLRDAPRMPYLVPPGYTEEELIETLEKAEAIIEHLSYELVMQGIYPETLQENVVEKQRMIADLLTRARWDG